jgi:uncharacterized protein (DUF1330 family)
MLQIARRERAYFWFAPPPRGLCTCAGRRGVPLGCTLMPAYVIGEVEIVKPEQMKAYGPLIAHAVKTFGGKYLARGTKPFVLEGGPAHNMMIIEFADVDTAKAWFDSPEYAAAKKVREGASNLRLVVVDDYVKSTA